jgi:hypothetical protein
MIANSCEQPDIWIGFDRKADAETADESFENLMKSPSDFVEIV